MNQENDKQKKIKLKNEAIKMVSDYLDFCLNCDEKEKKAELIAYWLKTYILYIQEEDDFDSTKLKEYRRGQIIKANLGFNIGSEQGGLHYCVVIDKQNSKKCSTLTVIPLTSKEKKSESVVSLGKEIYDSLLKKTELQLDIIVKKLEDTKLEYAEITKYNNADVLNEDVQLLIEAKTKKIISEIEELEKEITKLKKARSEVKRINKGTYALVNQITTISKQRIYDPKTNRDILADIKLSNESLDLIDEKLREMYIKKYN